MTRGKSINEKIRSVIVRLFNSGKSNSEILDLLQLSRHSVRNIVKQYKTTGSVVTKPRNVGKIKITETDRSLRRIIEKNRRANYLALSVLWSESVGRRISRSTCHREAHKME